MKYEYDSSNEELKKKFKQALQKEFLKDDGNFDGYSEFNDIQEEYVEVIFAMIHGEIEVSSRYIRELLADYMCDIMELKNANQIYEKIRRKYE